MPCLRIGRGAGGGERVHVQHDAAAFHAGHHALGVCGVLRGERALQEGGP